MAEAFDSFNAPQFVDFSKAQQDNFDESVDSYFDADHERESFVDTVDTYYSPISPHKTVPDSTQFYAPQDPLENSYEHHVEPKEPRLRKSMSVGNLVLFSEEQYAPYVENISENVQKLNISHNSNAAVQMHSKPKNNGFSNRSSGQNLRLKGSQDHLNKLAQPKRYASVENLREGNKGKFVSLAEQINTFQNRTPVRFRSKPNLAKQQPLNSQTLYRTVPESPALQTKTRSRPVHILSQEEREIIEFKNQQKFKIKANPVNKKVLQGPVKPSVPAEKHYTIPQPFNLTSVPPKKAVPTQQKYEFHAKPMPRSAEKAPRTQIEKRPLTKPKTPSFMKTYKLQVHVPEVKETKKMDTSKEHKLTKPKPFSFETRDKMIEKRREQLINKIREEERKAREFHARPMPKSIYRSGDSIKSDSGSSRCSSKRHPSSENLCTQFKARPPTVLYKEPFIPAKTEKPVTEPAPFDLYTDQRAYKREEYEMIRREKEERLEYLRKLHEEERLRKEQEEIAKLRKETEYKAKPIKKYKEVIIQPSNKITEPVSPKFATDILRKMKNKENIPNNQNISC